MRNESLRASHEALAYARERLNDIYREIVALYGNNPGERFFDVDPQTGNKIHKVRFSKPFPARCSLVAFEIITQCRAALDRAGYAMAKAAGVRKPKNAAFPFGQNPAEVESRHRPSKRTTGGSSDIPKEIFVYMASLKPYPGGDNLLWGMNKACNIHKHQELVKAQLRAERFKLVATPPYKPLKQFSGIVRGGWDASKNELALYITTPGNDPHYDVKFSLQVTFGDIEGIRGLPLFPVLDQMIRMVESILLGIEAEAARIGLTG